MSIYHPRQGQVPLPARPGDVLHLDVKCIGGKGMLFKFEGVASIDGKTVANANFSAMIVEPGR